MLFEYIPCNVGIKSIFVPFRFLFRSIILCKFEMKCFFIQIDYFVSCTQIELDVYSYPTCPYSGTLRSLEIRWAGAKMVEDH